MSGSFSRIKTVELYRLLSCKINTRRMLCSVGLLANKTFRRIRYRVSDTESGSSEFFSWTPVLPVSLPLHG